ncbi:hypothetical protein GQ54DRAFT_116310 [Martensiomyces pterosporus]|nr:hypothetical protein GQ54DRAFT_116310 [Martensiomyces pterosporus]
MDRIGNAMDVGNAEKQLVTSEADSSTGSSKTVQSTQQQPHLDAGAAEEPKGAKGFIKRFLNAQALVEYCVMALAGAALGIQAGANGKLASITDGYFTSFICMGIGMVVLTFTVVIEYFFFNKVSMVQVKETRWWQWTGAIWGVMFVTFNTLSLGRLGPAEVLGIVVGAQLISACVIDHFALFGMYKHRLTWQRVLGLAILIASIVVMVLW